MGGIVEGPDSHRVDSIARGLDPTMKVYVIDSGVPGAWSWSDRTVFVSRRLAQITTDDELAAAIAHELGHMRCASLSAPSAFAAPAAAIEVEARADAEGVVLLRRTGISPTAMSKLLIKLRSDSTSSQALQVALRERLSRLAIPSIAK